jgi:hypothetical protein
MNFGLAPPKNVTNLFGNWLKGISKNDFTKFRVGVCPVVWALWNTRNYFVFNKPKKILTGYSYGYPMDPYMVQSPTRGAARGNGF